MRAWQNATGGSVADPPVLELVLHQAVTGPVEEGYRTVGLRTSRGPIRTGMKRQFIASGERPSLRTPRL